MGRGGGQQTELSRRATSERVDRVGYLGVFSFGAEAIARGFRLGVKEILGDYSGNARHGSRMLERRVARSLGGKLAPEGSSHDVELADGARLEVRCFTSSVSFAPSHAVGSGRQVTAELVEKKFSSVDAFVICDVSRFPRVQSWYVPVDTTISWLDKGVLGARGKMSAAKFRRIAGDAPPAQLAPNLKRRLTRQARSSVDSRLRVHISVETGAAPPTIRNVGGPVSADIFAALARIKTNALLETEGVEGSEGTAAAAALLLDTLATPEVLALAAVRTTPDELHFFQLVREEGGRKELLLDIAPECNLIDLVARYVAAEDREPLALAFADALSTGWISSSSPEARAAGYAEEPIPL